MMRLHAAGLLVLALACRGPTYDTKGGGGDGGTTVPFTPDPPQAYVAKVKNVLVGLAPTDSEVQAVVQTPSALGGLVDQWMALPQYQQKMQVFFQLMFQQMQVGVSDFKQVVQPNDFVGQLQPNVIQNAIESFARTANAIAAANQSLTTTFTTNQFMMTTALMQYYGLMDWHYADDNDTISDEFSEQYKGSAITIETTSPIPNNANGIPETYDPTSPNFMHFYNAGGSAGTITISALQGAIQVTNVLYGQDSNNNYSAGLVQMLPSDFTDWRMVTITPAGSDAQSPAFYNLTALRAANSMALKIPRVGFFTTPAFAANWPTNSGNQMRAVLNQSLIVATGHQIDGTDGTIPMQTPGIDPVHDTGVCYGCHQLLDPMRDILSMNYTWFFAPQTNQQMISEGAWFAFEYVQSPMSTIQDYGQLLAQHPLVPAAWVQKLCYYVNSAPCDPTDPEYLRIVSDFQNNNLSWNALVREFMLSPITTNTSLTQTYETNGEVACFIGD